MKTVYTCAVLILACLILTAGLSAQNITYYPDGNYDQQIPKFEDITGFKHGERFTPYHLVVKYIKAVADGSPKVTLKQYGETNEKRPLYYMIITDESNLARIKDLRENILKLTDPEKTNSLESANQIIKNTPIIVWLSYNVHGNESCCTEGALTALYHLAAGIDKNTKDLLKNSVIIMDPCANPDGRDRYVNWYNMQMGGSPNMDRNSVEHREPWPGGRSNHYLFDLNRDWAWVTQKETVHRLKVYREWMPQVFTDFHEMGVNSSYFFFPSAKPKNPNLDPETLKWEDTFGRGNASAFDAFNWEYYSGERFDLFYPGYGDSWPSLNGATGMTYEQGGSGRAGLIYKREDKTTVSLWSRLRHHYVASIATISTAARNREARLTDFYRFYKKALEDGQTSSVKAYVFTEKYGKDRALDLAKLLTTQGINVERSEDSFTLIKAKKYYAKDSKKHTFAKGTYIVRTAQPQYRLLNALLEPETSLPDTFFYDIAAWSLPVAYGLESYISNEEISVETRPVSSMDVLKGKSSEKKAGYAYLVPWKSINTGKFVSELLKNECAVEYAAKSFTMNNRKYDRGTIVIKSGRNKENIHEIIAASGKKFGVDIFTTSTGYSEKGIDLGSDNVRDIKKPVIGLFKEDFISSSSFGSAWQLLDETLNFEYSVIRTGIINNSQINNYTTLIFPSDGSGNGYKRAIDSSGVQKLKSWIQNGGTYIGIQGGAFFASQDISKIAGVKIKKLKKPESKEEKEKDKKEKDLQRRKKTEQKEKEFWQRIIPGIIVKMELDNSHPLGYGCDNEMYVFKRGTRIFELSDKGDNVGIIHKNPNVAGFVSQKNANLIGDGLYLYHQRYGRGHIILFTDDPNFRGFLLGHKMLLLNAIIFGAN